MDDLLTTQEAAQLLGVSPTSIKRWADQGLLRCAKTIGRHRRFRRAEVEALRTKELERKTAEPAPSSREWSALLQPGADVHALVARLLELRGQLGSWWRASEQVGVVLEDLGERWARGDIRIIDEHLASDVLGRAIQQVSQSLSVAPGAPRCLLVTCKGEEHVLGLMLAEVCARAAGWQTLFAGRATPRTEIAALAAAEGVELIAVSASRCAADAKALRSEAEALAKISLRHGAELVLGGRGAWPDRPHQGKRIDGFAHFDRLLRDTHDLARAKRAVKGT